MEVLEYSLPAGKALRIIFRKQLSMMEYHLEHARQNLDPEFLHDFRVAIRRTRSLLGVMKDVLPADMTQSFRSEFKWLAQMSSPTRDLDVYLLKLPDYQAGLPDAVQDDLQPVVDYLTRCQKQEQRKLSDELDSERCRRLLAAWRTFIENQSDEIVWPGKATRPVGELANRRTWNIYLKVIRKGEAINADSPATTLHELRIICKKLRYLMEFFQSLYPLKPIRKQIKALKMLQDNLGEFHDLEVHASVMQAIGNAIQSEQADLRAETFMAMGRVIELMHHRQEEVRLGFAERFRRFASPRNRKICEDMFHPAASKRD